MGKGEIGKTLRQRLGVVDMNKLVFYGKRLMKEMKEDRATGLAAQQAYYYMLAIFPLLILVLSIIPYFSIDPSRAVGFVEEYMPSESAEMFSDIIVNIVSERNGGLLTFGILGTIWSASNGVNAFMRAMNIAYGVEESRSFIKARLVSILLTFGLIVSLIVALVLPVFGGVILEFIKGILHVPDNMQIIFQILRWLLAVTVMVLVLSVLYKMAPNKDFPFKHVFPGAITATILWQLVSLGFSYYVSNFGNYSATYGSLGGVIILMLWLFLTGLILVLGGEVNAIYHRHTKDSEHYAEETKTY